MLVLQILLAVALLGPGHRAAAPRAAAAPAAATAALVLHVRGRSPLAYRSAAAAADVVAAAPAADGSAVRPFRTVAAARNALRQYRSERPLPEGGATILLHTGTHAPLTLDGDLDSGESAHTQITYAAANDGPVTLSGGITVPAAAFVPWRGGGILRADLAPLGITTADLGTMNQSGAGLVGGCVNRKAVLMLGVKRMTLARYPNKGGPGVEDADTNRARLGFIFLLLFSFHVSQNLFTSPGVVYCTRGIYNSPGDGFNRKGGVALVARL